MSPAAASAFPIDMEAGNEHNCVITDCDTTWCWGRNTLLSSGEDADVSAPYVDIAVGTDHTCGLRGDNSLVECWGRVPNLAAGENEAWDLTAAPPDNFVEIDGGAFLTCGIKDDGFMDCWGWDNHGEASTYPVSPVTGNNPKFKNISAGYQVGCGVTPAGGAVYCWGNTPGGIGRVDVDDVKEFPGERFVKVSAGSGHICALTDYGDGTGTGAIYCWGSDSAGQSSNVGNGQLRTIPTLEGQAKAYYIAGIWDDVSAGGVATCGVKIEGGLNVVECWGYPYTPTSLNLTSWSWNNPNLAPADQLPANRPPLPPGFSPDRVFLDYRQVCAIDDLQNQVECWSAPFFNELGELDVTAPQCSSVPCNADDLNQCI